ncbi:MAG: Pr6Pr family membrane protein [Solirubrobacteraceae bacterium]
MSSSSTSVSGAECRAQRGALSQTATRVCRAVLALAALAAIGYDVAAGPGVSDADYFSYFTVLSNLFAAAMLMYGALRPASERSRAVDLLRGAAVAYILTTGIVYLLLLSGHAPAYPWVNAILHYLMPVAVTLDWLLDPPRSRLAPARTVVLWMAFPLLYVLCTLARGAIVGWYPYFFVNPHRSGGYLLVAGDCLAVGIGIVALVLTTTWAGNRRCAALAA